MRESTEYRVSSYGRGIAVEYRVRASWYSLVTAERTEYRVSWYGRGTAGEYRLQSEQVQLRYRREMESDRAE